MVLGTLARGEFRPFEEDESVRLGPPPTGCPAIEFAVHTRFVEAGDDVVVSVEVNTRADEEGLAGHSSNGSSVLACSEEIGGGFTPALLYAEFDRETLCTYDDFIPFLGARVQLEVALVTEGGKRIETEQSLLLDLPSASRQE